MPGAGGNPSGGGGNTTGGGNTPGGGGNSPGGGGKPSDDGFDWAPWGPADPGDPPPYDWYGSLERRQCDALKATDDDLWRALGAVCAAIEGDQSQWTIAKTLAANGGTHDPTSCLERAARALLHRALAWRERNPGRRPVVRFPVPGSSTACPFRIDTVRLWKDGQEADGPLEGPVTGGTELAIRGPGLSDDPTQVLIAGREAKRVITDVGKTVLLVVETPEVDQPLTAEVRVRNSAGEVVAPVTFRYKLPDSSTGTTG